MTPPSENPQILIAGAGIGGLTCALSLMKAGYRVRLFEAAPELGEVGAGIQHSANAVKILHHLGWLMRLTTSRYGRKRIDSASTAPGKSCRACRSASRMNRASVLRMFRSTAPIFTRFWPKRFSPRTPIALRWMRASPATNRRRPVLPCCSRTAKVAKGHLLIGADGIKSAVRASSSSETSRPTSRDRLPGASSCRPPNCRTD